MEGEKSFWVTFALWEDGFDWILFLILMLLNLNASAQWVSVVPPEMNATGG